MDNYCPISVLPVLSKILERTVYRHLYHYLQKHKILELAAISFADTISRNMEQGQMTAAMFIDLGKAFDILDHSVLLRKLSDLGIVGLERKSFTDYLRNRTQVVKLQGLMSSPEDVSTGVPQGSILGPLLFMLHVNNLPETTSECSILMHTDDTVFCSVHPPKLPLLRRSSLKNYVKLNDGFLVILCYLTLQRLSSVDSVNVNINDKQISRVHEFTCLGVAFDDRLSWNSRVNQIMISKAGSA